MEFKAKKLLIFGIIGYFLIHITSCEPAEDEIFNPKPKAYLRIELPTPSYKKFDSLFPYSFEYSSHSIISPDKSKNSEPYWINIEYPQFGAVVYLSYKKINNNFAQYKKDAIEFANKHIQLADDIVESDIYDTITPVTGKIFEIKGINVASSYQFWVSDSSSKFLRGALYFNTKPNNDSLSPVINYIKNDMLHLINTIKWNNKVR